MIIKRIQKKSIEQCDEEKKSKEKTAGRKKKETTADTKNTDLKKIDSLLLKLAVFDFSNEDFQKHAKKWKIKLAGFNLNISLIMENT